ncbi:hypothetical protein [Streptosporangium sp. NPDC006007]|uniref:hypothetical protein n=1 Tax=Streptosporangium sp. NPDC006007 TaxID=3154575 RepID=UPI0033B5B97A
MKVLAVGCAGLIHPRHAAEPPLDRSIRGRRAAVHGPTVSTTRRGGTRHGPYQCPEKMIPPFVVNPLPRAGGHVAGRCSATRLAAGRAPAGTQGGEVR